MSDSRSSGPRPLIFVEEGLGGAIMQAEGMNVRGFRISDLLDIGPYNIFLPSSTKNDEVVSIAISRGAKIRFSEKEGPFIQSSYLTASSLSIYEADYALFDDYQEWQKEIVDSWIGTVRIYGRGSHPYCVGYVNNLPSAIISAKNVIFCQPFEQLIVNSAAVKDIYLLSQGLEGAPPILQTIKCLRAKTYQEYYEGLINAI